ncbi:small RNA-binding protein 11, chloroplastic isoform X2 [Diospyros lotus]|uniref:small RNA-binding protein 11, chloroplastic isoform X2 n=1 Tax=Diospyros lotus TaxID=55363 RepID=UPI002253CDF3|nr:small RNA-binding protein 11, chloroplastic isoform X2 [Diospyros lotus]
MYAGIRFGSSQPIAAKSQRNSAKSECLKLQASLSDYPLASKVMVRNLPYTTTESCLKKEFSRFGEIAEVKLVRDEASKRSKGYAFIQYTNQDDALQALECMDQKHYNGRLIFVELARPEQSAFGSYPRASGPPQEENLAKSDEAME